MSAERVLGVDPGTRRLGWGVVERRGPKLVALAAGVVKLHEKESLERRLASAYDALEEIIDTYVL